MRASLVATAINTVSNEVKINMEELPLFLPKPAIQPKCCTAQCQITGCFVSEDLIQNDAGLSSSRPLTQVAEAHWTGEKGAAREGRTAALAAATHAGRLISGSEQPANRDQLCSAQKCLSPRQIASKSILCCTAAKAPRCAGARSLDHVTRAPSAGGGCPRADLRNAMPVRGQPRPA